MIHNHFTWHTTSNMVYYNDYRIVCDHVMLHHVAIVFTDECKLMKLQAMIIGSRCTALSPVVM